ncbi:uncharacterized protein LOC124795738 [Schistocerca piceifrons]|uniref:uncharacterized protein LOC124795738 n=1 Tax=Schistocerca piceifrons TaxID=274613 RepID=UPI001F5F64A1|nr:uncharacterized protein LOC124795738 [Schistocerca piceifrons]
MVVAGHSIDSEESCCVAGKAVPFVELTVAHASVLTILAISFERYYAICEPLRAGYVCTKARALLICLLAWALAALLTSPMLAISQFAYHQYADGSLVPTCLSEAAALWQKLFFTVSSATFFAVPVAVLLALYGKIARHLMAAPGAAAAPPEAGGNVRARRQVVLMLATVVLSFFLCLLPFRAFTLWIVFASSASVRALGIEAYYSLLYFCRTMFYLNSAVNPILYSLMSSKFRAGFARLFGYRERQLALLRGADGEMRNGAGRAWPTLAAVRRQHRSAPDLFAWRSGSRSSLASVRSAAAAASASTAAARGPAALARAHCPLPAKRTASDAGPTWKERSARSRMASFRRNAVMRSTALSFDLDGRGRDASEPLKGNNASDSSSVLFSGFYFCLDDTLHKDRLQVEKWCTKWQKAQLVSDDGKEERRPGSKASVGTMKLSNRCCEDVLVSSASGAGACSAARLSGGTSVPSVGDWDGGTCRSEGPGDGLDETVDVARAAAPVTALSSYELAEYTDGSVVAICLTEAATFWAAAFFVAAISLFFLLPLVVLVALYSVIARHLMEAPDIVHHHQHNHYRYRKQVVLMLGTVVVSFFVCLLPFRALTLWIIVAPPEALMSLGMEGYYNLLYFCRTMHYLNSAVNPILYNLMSSKFRNGFARLCCGRRRSRRAGGSEPLGRKGTATSSTAATNTTAATSGTTATNATTDGGSRRHSRCRGRRTSGSANGVCGDNSAPRDSYV